MERVINVPQAYEQAFADLAALSNDSFDQMLVALSDDAYEVETIVSRLTPVLGDVQTARNFQEAVTALAQYVEENLDSIEEAAQGVASGLAEIASRSDSLTMRIEKVLKSPAISLLVHAQSVLDAQERLVLSMRLFTTVRPVFGLDPDELVGSVIYHDLRIEYLDANRKRCAFVAALDGSKLLQLRDQITRAESKVERVENLMQGTEVPVFGLRVRGEE